MENASKAILIAAGFVMGVAILSLAVYLYASFSGSADMINQNIEEGNRNQFNNQYIEYTAKENNVYDIYSVVNLANDYNKNNEFTQSDTDYYIGVYVKVGNKVTNVNNYNSTKLKSFLEGNSAISAGELTFNSTYSSNVYELSKFSASVDYSGLTGRVNKITFTKK